MVPVTVSLAELLAPFRAAFARPESFAVFQPVVVAWVLCLRLWKEKLFGEGRDGEADPDLLRQLLNEMAAAG